MQIGVKVRDRITGFTGIVTGFVRYITGCNQCLVAPPVKENGEFADSHWIDVQRLEVLPGNPIVLDSGTNPGPDAPAPKR